MSDSIVISDGNAQVSDKAMLELFRRMEPFISRAGGGGTDVNAVHFNDPNTTLPTRYLTVTANDDIPGDDASIHLETGGAVGDFDIIAGSIGNLTLTAEGGAVQIEADDGVVAVVASSDINLLPSGDLNVNLTTGQTAEIHDHLGNPLATFTG